MLLVLLRDASRCLAVRAGRSLRGDFEVLRRRGSGALCVGEGDVEVDWACWSCECEEAEDVDGSFGGHG